MDFFVDFYRHFNEAKHVASTISDWTDHRFTWKKAYVSAVFASTAYEEIPEFELKKSKRAKVIPCERYQALFARLKTTGQRASMDQLDTGIPVEVVVRRNCVITIAKLPNVIFVSFRGTTLSFSDFKADLDARKVKYRYGYSTRVRLHQGFFEAVTECIEEINDRVTAMTRDAYLPVYVTGHSLGGAMAAIYHAMVNDENLRQLGRLGVAPIHSEIACYTFGMPRYGDVEAKVMLPQPYHIYNELDAIPTLPPKFLGFADSVNERCLNAIPELISINKKGSFFLRSGKGIATVLGVSDHRMERYVARTDAMKDQ